MGVLTETITGVTIEYFYSFFLFLVPKNIWTVILDNLVIIMFYLGQRMLSKVHQMGKQREGNLQAGGQQGRLQTVGASQEQTGHELRDHGQSSQVRLAKFII